MEPKNDTEFFQMNERLERIERSVERTRRYFLWSLIAQLALVVIPLVALMFLIPFFLSTFSRGLEGLL